MGKRGNKQKRYSAEFKIGVIMDRVRRVEQNRFSGLARSTYYYYLHQKDKDKYEMIKSEIVEIFNKNKGRYGYQRITRVLKE